MHPGIEPVFPPLRVYGLYLRKENAIYTKLQDIYSILPAPGEEENLQFSMPRIFSLFPHYFPVIREELSTYRLMHLNIPITLLVATIHIPH